jgi:5'-3' exoribonuclease 1
LVEAAGKGAAIANAFDSNCITPGTTFMSEISSRLHTFIQAKLQNDPRWAHLEVVYSGHDVPGEGEHKIMQYIRDYKVGPHYDPAVTHCMYGNDADLILLALATHEPNFCILREVMDIVPSSSPF